MKEWKIRQEVYHRLNRDFDDDLKDKNIVITQNIVKNAVRYFREKDIGWIYPSKSYMVAICYSKWLAKEFGGNPLDFLCDEDLLYSNDPFFISYHKDKDTYDEILKQINYWDFDENLGMVPDVKEYFLKEFMVK